MPYGARTGAGGRNCPETSEKTRPSTPAAAASGCRYGAQAASSVVAKGDLDQQRAGPRVGGFPDAQSARDRAFVGPFRRGEHAPEVGAVSLRDVDADLLRQPRRQAAARPRSQDADAREA